MEEEQQYSRGRAYTTEDYAVRTHWVFRIMNIFQIDKSKVVDAFASNQNRRFENYIDRQQDALKQVWQK